MTVAIVLRTVGLFLMAVAIAASAFSGCASSTKVGRPVQDELFERYNRSALQAFERADSSKPPGFTEKQLDRAYIRDDSEAIVDALYNLAICLINLQSYDKALAVIKRGQNRN